MVIKITPESEIVQRISLDSNGEDYVYEGENLNIWPVSGVRFEGRMQILLVWYELPAHEGNPYIIMDQKFSSYEDMEKFLQDNEDRILDVLGAIESTWTEIIPLFPRKDRGDEWEPEEKWGE